MSTAQVTRSPRRSTDVYKRQAKHRFNADQNIPGGIAAVQAGAGQIDCDTCGGPVVAGKIIAIAAGQGVVARASGQSVIARAAEQLVIARATHQQIMARSALQPVGLVAAEQAIGIARADHRLDADQNLSLIHI